MEAPAPAFQTGDPVHLRSDRARVGQVEGQPRRVGGEFWYRIRFVAGPPQMVPEPDLDRFSQEVTPGELLARGALGDREDFLRLVTFHKLNVPLDNTLYSLQSSRTEFYPHQYRPLVKLLDPQNPRQRLLVADEVGLGKTIEAGLILAELRARRALRSVMVVCPKALCLKWQEEMWRRFDEEFQIYAGDDVRRLVELLEERGGEVGNIRVIVPLQTIRREALLELLEVNRIPLDLLIVDEAHHLRNPGTLSHKVVAALAEYAGAVVLLTATPIQIGNQNLFHLLRILDPAEFEDLDTFLDRLAANEPVVDAERLIRSAYPPPLDEVRNRLRRLQSGRARLYFERNPLFHRIRDELDARQSLSKEDVARFQHDLKELNLLGHVLTRTRKREVFASAAVRTPSVCQPQATDAERRFYRAVTDFARAAAQGTTGQAPPFGAIMAQRMVASCMPAARERFRKQASRSLAAPVDWEWLDEPWLELDAEVAPPATLPERVLEAAAALGDVDTKFDALLRILSELDETEPGRKILLFSYFRGTLHYLHRRLREAGYVCEVITGEVPSDPRNPDRDERGLRMRRFRDPGSGVRILLSSEVGSEGLDFQFCHILINYDLPWNPMLVEQRIGRVDRLGQRSDRILIFNFSTPGTIEDRILERLYNRIGIFTQSVGDLEAILGDEVTRLTRDLLSQHLTPTEEEDRIERAYLAIEQRRHAIAQLETDATRFISSDAYFEEQLERARRGGELLSPADLEAFFRAFLEHHYRRSRLRPSSPEGVFALEVDHELDTAVRTQPGGAPKFRLLQRLGRGPVRITFDSDLAFSDDTVEFLAAHHPLMQLAVRHYRENRHELHAASALIVRAGGVPGGVYCYGLYEVTIRAGRERKRLEPLFLRVDDGLVVPENDGSELLGQLLRSGRRWDDAPALDGEITDSLLNEVEGHFLERLECRRRELADRNVAVAEIRLASLEAAHRARLGRKTELLEQAQERGRQERYIRMIEGTIRNMIADHESRRAELEAEKSVQFTCNLVGCGILSVEAG